MRNVAVVDGRPVLCVVGPDPHRALRADQSCGEAVFECLPRVERDSELDRVVIDLPGPAPLPVALRVRDLGNRCDEHLAVAEPAGRLRIRDHHGGARDPTLQMQRPVLPLGLARREAGSPQPRLPTWPCPRPGHRRDEFGERLRVYFPLLAPPSPDPQPRPRLASERRPRAPHLARAGRARPHRVGHHSQQRRTGEDPHRNR